MPADGYLDGDGILVEDPPATGNPGAGVVDSSSSPALLPVSCIGSSQPGDPSDWCKLCAARSFLTGGNTKDELEAQGIVLVISRHVLNRSSSPQHRHPSRCRGSTSIPVRKMDEDALR